MKHVDIKFQLIQDKVQKGEVILFCCQILEIATYSLIKAVPRNKHFYFASVFDQEL